MSNKIITLLIFQGRLFRAEFLTRIHVNTQFYTERDVHQTRCADEIAILKTNIQYTEAQLHQASEILQKHQAEYDVVCKKPCPPPIG